MTDPKPPGRTERAHVFLTPQEMDALNRYSGANAAENPKNAGRRRAAYIRDNLNQTENLLLRPDDIAALRQAVGIPKDQTPNQGTRELCSAFVRAAIYQAVAHHRKGDHHG